MGWIIERVSLYRLGGLIKLKRFTKEEDELILQGELELPEIAKVLNRSYFVVYNRKKRLIGNGHETKTKVPVCPSCGSKDCNTVNTLTDGKGYNVIEAHYCMNCLHEFKNGKIIRPLF